MVDFKTSHLITRVLHSTIHSRKQALKKKNLLNIHFHSVLYVPFILKIQGEKKSPPAEMEGTLRTKPGTGSSCSQIFWMADHSSSQLLIIDCTHVDTGTFCLIIPT